MNTRTSLGATELLSFAAAPTFATMALLSAIPGGGPLDALCSAAHDASPLMSAFHSAPWLKLIAGRFRSGTRRQSKYSRPNNALP